MYQNEEVITYLGTRFDVRSAVPRSCYQKYYDSLPCRLRKSLSLVIWTKQRVGDEMRLLRGHC